MVTVFWSHPSIGYLLEYSIDSINDGLRQTPTAQSPQKKIINDFWHLNILRLTFYRT